MIKAPTLTGPYASHRHDVTLTDRRRKDPHVLEAMPRMLSLNIFTPTEQPSRIHPYDPDACLFWQQAPFWSQQQKGYLTEALQKFHSYSAPYQPSSLRQSYPLVLFSHGFLAFGTLYSYLIEELVSHGFVVVAINHTHASSYAKIDKTMVYGKMTQKDLFQDSFADQEQSIWTEDMLYVLNQIIDKNINTLTHLVDLDNIFAVGHSFGGSTAVRATHHSSSIKGCVNLDGALFGVQTIENLRQPCLLLQGEKSLDSMVEKNTVARLQKDFHISEASAKQFQEAYVHRLEKLASTSQKTQRVVMKGIDHMGFTDFNFLSQSALFQGVPIGTLAPDQMINAIRRHVLHFLNEQMAQQ